MMESTTSRPRILAACVLSLLPGIACAAPPRVTVEFIAPDGGSAKPPTQLDFGWPLTIRATIQNDLGTYDLGGRVDAGVLEEAFIVLSDPGGCFEQILIAPDYSRACLTTPPTATYMELSADHDTLGVADDLGNDALIVASSVPGPSYPGLTQSGTIVDYYVGPRIGSGTRDGIAYGANDDWPGLVLLSDHGVGLVLDSDFNRPPVEQRRNLAGLLDSVFYELTDAKGNTRVSAVTNAPHGLLGPIIQADGAVGQPVGGNYPGPVLYRVDGGPLQSAPIGPLQASIQRVYEYLTSNTVFELRAFVVSGTAPSVLSDMTGDGRVDSIDATLSGYTVLSSEETLRLRVVPGSLLWCAMLVPADFDGNGAVDDGCGDGDIGPGRITRPPN